MDMDEMQLDAAPEFQEAKIMHLHEEMATLFTKKRIQIIHTIHKKNPKTIGELAKFLQRNISAVYRDLKVLEKHEIVLLEKQGKSVRPTLRNTSVTITLVHSIEKEEHTDGAEEDIDVEEPESESEYIG